MSYVDERLDVDELRARLTEATDEAFELADQFAEALINLGDPHAAAGYARRYQLVRSLIRSLRRMLKVETSG